MREVGEKVLVSLALVDKNSIAFVSVGSLAWRQDRYFLHYCMDYGLYLRIEIYCTPTADARDLWQASMTHIALERGCFVMSANQFCRRKDYPPPPEYMFSGTYEDLSPESLVCAGGGVIISPLGTILAGPNYEGEALILADLGMIILL
ncbi:hypothetical protein IFM89_017784 [Coptis chinensis]|uniref:CN hydrolase domain-containing protein n=1 Tax=Coptis chinensis TaxID=261450 RepID=A0A835I0V5_9MAGN|nr:hypothetical protein IFM89_017784 [Coptis chinensis]